MKKNVLVTGGAGFIGSWLVKAYLQKSYNVIVVDNFSTGKIENIESVLEDIKLFKVDLKDKKGLEEVFKSVKIDFVNHHAGQSSVVVSFKDMCEDANNNIIGSLNLLDLCLKYGVKKMIYASTGGAIYGDVEKNPVNENRILNAQSPYAISKHVFEHYLFMANKIWGFDYVVLRYGNVYGPYQSFDGESGVVAIFVDRMLKNEDVFIYGDGEQTRDYIYIKDVVDVNLRITEYLLGNEVRYNNFLDGVYNVGTGKEISVNQIFRYIADILNYTKKPIYKPSRWWEIKRISLDFSKLQNFIS